MALTSKKNIKIFLLFFQKNLFRRHLKWPRAGRDDTCQWNITTDVSSLQDNDSADDNGNTDTCYEYDDMMVVTMMIVMM